LIGLKLQAIKNNPEVKQKDMMDIESLLSIHGKEIDRSLIKGYFQIFDMEELYKRIIDG